MREVMAVFLRGLIGVIGVIVLVAAVWTAYLQREALAAAVAPAADLVQRLRGVSSADDTATGPTTTPVTEPTQGGASGEAADANVPGPTATPSTTD